MIEEIRRPSASSAAIGSAPMQRYTAPMAASRVAGAWWIVAATVLWSTGGAGIKLAPMPAMAVVCGRAVFTVAFYLIVFRPALRRASLLTACAYAGMTLTFVYATKTTTAANAIFLQYTAPVYVLALAPLMLHEPFQRIDAAAVIVALGGMALFFVDRLAPGTLRGNLAGVVCGVFCAATTLSMRRETANNEDVSASLPSITFGNALAGVVALPFAWEDLGAALTVRGGLMLAYLGVVQIGVAYLCFIRGLRTVNAIDASLLSLLEAALNPVWALALTGERPGLWAVFGGVLILGATVVRTLVLERRFASPATTRYASGA